MNTLLMHLFGAILVVAAFGIARVKVLRDVDVLYAVVLLAFIGFVATWMRTPRVQHGRLL